MTGLIVGSIEDTSKLFIFSRRDYFVKILTIKEKDGQQMPPSASARDCRFLEQPDQISSIN